MAEYWILDQELNEEERKKFANFIPERSIPVMNRNGV
jgi:hypothetical protein